MGGKSIVTCDIRFPYIRHVTLGKISDRDMRHWEVKVDLLPGIMHGGVTRCIDIRNIEEAVFFFPLFYFKLSSELPLFFLIK